MDIIYTRQPDSCAPESTDAANPTTSTAASVNPWAAPRAHYAQVKRILSWQSCVFQRGASLIKTQAEIRREQDGS
jgi:hypothetical protein